MSKPGWHLKDVTVESVTDGRLWTFDCNMWFDKNREDGRIERELIPSPLTEKSNTDDFYGNNKNKPLSPGHRHQYERGMLLF